MSPTRIGRQTPTKSYILPYEMTLGAEAVKVYKRTCKSAMEWQTLILDNIMGQNEEGLWVHSRFANTTLQIWRVVQQIVAFFNVSLICHSVLTLNDGKFLFFL